NAPGQAIDNYLKTIPETTIDVAKPVNGIVDKEIARAEKVGADTLADRLTELKSTWNKNYDLESMTPIEANQFRRDLGNITSFAGEANRLTINKVQKQIVDAVGAKIADVAPGVRPLNDAYANLLSTQTVVKQAAKKPRGDSLEHHFGPPFMARF